MSSNNPSIFCPVLRVAGSEAYAAARLAYHSAKVSGKNLGMDDVIEDLSKQFRRVRKTQTAVE